MGDGGRRCVERDGGLRCMYTNVDGYNNKRAEFLARIAEKKPDIIGLVEIMPKRASCRLMQEDLTLRDILST